ncbi:leucine-rich repeat domain-containing protein, partial [Enterococcus hulanensis]|uniref:leucine-rich repeat domain-containing protein n=1 Tax=Enterococcus hulanensis TaxID=2559929 RepID=UPI001A8FE821
MTNNYRRLLVSISFLVLQGISPLIALAEPTKVDQTISSDVPTIADTSDALPDLPDEPKKESETAPKQTEVEPDADPEGEDDDETSEEPLSDKAAANTNKGATPYATTLIEGVDIDATFANLLRTTKSTTNNNGSWSGYGKAQDQLTVSDMEALTRINVNHHNLTSLKGVEFAVNLEGLVCNSNPLTELDLSSNISLLNLDIGATQLETIDLDANTALTSLNAAWNLVLKKLDLRNNTALITLSTAYSDQLTTLKVNGSLETLDCRNNQIQELDLRNCPNLKTLHCSSNSLNKLELACPLLTLLSCERNQLQELDLSGVPALKILSCRDNKLNKLEIANPVLTDIDCTYNQLQELDLSGAPALETLSCGSNKLTELNLSGHSTLKRLSCGSNNLTESKFNLNGCITLNRIESYNNNFTNLNFLNVTDHAALQILEFSSNNITDITGALGLTNLTQLNCRQQKIQIDVPIVNSGNATVDILKTTASTGLSVTSNITGSPIITPNGDIIELSNVTPDSLANRYLSFDYSSSDLVEGSSTTTKRFQGNILFAPVSNLKNQLIPTIPKVETGGLVSWTWSIQGVNREKANNIYADLSLPPELVVDPTSILVNGSPGTTADIDGTNNLGDLDIDETIEITFKTTAIGIVDDWLEATGKLKWEDTSPRANQTQGVVQIKDDEQTYYTPNRSKAVAFLSIPESFRFGVWDVKNTAQVYNLSSSNYLTNTNVVSNGFYTRLRADRLLSTGWKLSAQLSDFTDSANNL